MVIIKLMGGLASQIHKYSIGYTISQKTNSPLKVDTSWFREQNHTDTTRKFLIDQYSIEINEASNEEINALKSDKLKLKIKKLFDKYIEQEVITKHSYKSFFDHSYMDRIRPPIYIEGEWFGDSLIKEQYHILKNMFKLRSSVGFNIEKNSASVHIRRGDFYNSPNSKKIHGVLSEDFYIKAMKLSERIGIRSFYIFSDEIEWVKNNYIKIQEFPVNFIEEQNELIEFELMKKFTMNITSNSGFSWLSSWLGNSEYIISPRRWVSDDQYNQKILNNISDSRVLFL